MFDMKKMMEQAQQMQFKMPELQEKFKEIYVEGNAGGGLVKVTMNCVGKVKALSIDPSLMNSNDKETLEDLVIAAVNSASAARETRVTKESNQMMLDSGIDPSQLG